ncbi:MAG: carboxypeptidase-like regulatory domain-containing protein, partial [Bacteroidales bacterium]|nr:carboxypeptidase-like regulatory domain-containing protein [Bacteroidales bacterium]
MKHLFLGLLLTVLSCNLFSQTLSGTVLEYDAKAKSKTKALPFANVYWLNTLKGTTTDDNGKFSLEQTAEDGSHLVVSFVGYSNDTLDIKLGDNDIKILLSSNVMLEEVQIVQRQQGAYVSRLNSVK